MIAKKIMLVFLFFIPSCLWANTDEVTLFEQNRAKIDKKNKASKTPAMSTKKIKKGKTLNKKLIGIQRLGSRYTVIFKNKQGQQERFLWEQTKDQKPIEIESGFFVEHVEQRQVKIKLTNQVRCIADEKLKIECPDAEHMNLAIQRSKAMIKQKNIPGVRKSSQKLSSRKKTKKRVVKKVTQQNEQQKKKPVNPFLSIINARKEKQVQVNQ